MKRLSNQVRLRRRKAWLDLPANEIEEVNAQVQRDKLAKEKALLVRIVAEKRTLIVSKALGDALQVLGERHGFEEWQETLSTLLINLAAAPAEESACYVSLSRPGFEITQTQSRQLDAFSKTGIEFNLD